MRIHAAAPGKQVREGIEFLRGMLKGCTACRLAIRFWDGTEWHAGGDEPACFTLVLRHPGALRSMFWRPNQLTLGDAYLYDDYDIEGDICAAFALADHLLSLSWGLKDMMRTGKFLLSLPRPERHDDSRKAHLRGIVHSPQRDRQAVTYHYNISNDFFRLWLDPQMVYSCGYFATGGEELDAAQERKLDYICRKLRLKPGERLLDIGCGWGSLVIHAARHYGVDALGITLSQPQAELAGERIRKAGIEDRCRVEVRDYRELRGQEQFDKLASIGMVEHVGRSRLRGYFRQAWRLLRPGGVFLNHGISGSLSEPLPGGPSFVDQYVFPDGDLPPVSTTLRAAEKSGFEARDLENLREHYALTLRRWVKRLEARHDEAVRVADEVTYRIWRLYMAGSAHSFDCGRLNLYQLLLVKPERGRSNLPLTRADWYR
jgi:cyclopropane-fatty-acyl-phospholipid synthase